MYDFCTSELFRHVTIILNPGSHHHDNGHMNGRNMTVKTVQKIYNYSSFKT